MEDKNNNGEAWHIARVKRISNDTSFDISYYQIQQGYIGNVLANSSFTDKDAKIEFPWVGNINEFIDRVLVIELVDKTRFYLFDYDWHLYYFQSNKYLQAPFTGPVKIKMDGTEFGQRNLINGNNDKDHWDKELIFFEKNGSINLEIRNA